jgi:hypothetical protein
MPRKALSENELAYFEVFDFFNYPRLPSGLVSSAVSSESPAANMKEYFVTTNFTPPDPEQPNWGGLFRTPQG